MESNRRGSVQRRRPRRPPFLWVLSEGMGVTSSIRPIFIPKLVRALRADWAPGPGVFVRFPPVARSLMWRAVMPSSLQRWATSWAASIAAYGEDSSRSAFTFIPPVTRQMVSLGTKAQGPLSPARLQSVRQAPTDAPPLGAGRRPRRGPESRELCGDRLQRPETRVTRRTGRSNPCTRGQPAETARPAAGVTPGHQRPCKCQDTPRV